MKSQAKDGLADRADSSRSPLAIGRDSVPDSGTGGLEGISGTLHILIEGKKHRYDLEYILPPRQGAGG